MLYNNSEEEKKDILLKDKKNSYRQYKLFISIKIIKTIRATFINNILK